MEFDPRDRVIRFPAEDRELAADEKPLMVSNKLIIKLKVGDNNRELVVHGDKEHQEDHRRALRSNAFDGISNSGKEIVSRKAFGGHIQKSQDQAVLAGVAGAGGGCFSRKSYNLLVKNGKPTCSLCGKTFPSLKSLFGHMRCHPDRDYRGMRPPDAFKLASRSGGATAAMDLLRRLPGWSVKAKRSCISVAMEDYDEDKMVKGAVYGLMLMATGNDSYRYLDDDKDGDEDNPSKKLQISSISNKKPRLIHGSSSDEEQNCADSDHNSGIESNALGKKRKRESVQVKDWDPSNRRFGTPDAAAAANCHKCSICDQTFMTHQALGGHKSSAHYKLLIKNMAHHEPKLVEHGGLGEVKTHQFDHQEGINAIVFANSQPLPPPAPATPIIVSEEGTTSHVCKTCDKEFPSGQALGGHMRRHWPGPPSSSSLLPGMVELVMMRSDGPDHSGSSTVTAETRPVLVFDLNQLPADDTEEQVKDKQLVHDH